MRYWLRTAAGHENGTARGAHGHGAGVFNTKEHKERRDRMDRNTKIFCVFKDAGNGARRRGAAAGMEC